ncbi:MAG: type II secretion system minor pseudopilin GspJ [Pseudomonadota bacterium]
MKSALQCGHQGFTLIELLIATAVFAILGVMAYGGLNSVLTAQSHITTQADQLKTLQLSLRYIQRDIEQLVDRGIRDKFGDQHAPLILGDHPQISLTHSGWRNPAGLTRSQLQRVAYDVDDGTLMRTTWSQLDGIDLDQLQQTQLLNEVEELKIRVLDKEGKWHERWPLEEQISETENLPLAVELQLTAEPWGKIRRLIALTR